MLCGTRGFVTVVVGSRRALASSSSSAQRPGTTSQFPRSCGGTYAVHEEDGEAAVQVCEAVELVSVDGADVCEAAEARIAAGTDVPDIAVLM